MWWALEAWTVPLVLEHLLKESYANVEVVEVGPCHRVLFVILCGILQGDPLSGTMFVIGAQPFVEAHMQQLEAKALGLTRWCADDIQALIFCRRGLRTLARIFRLAERLAGLQLQPKKCAAVPLWAPFSAEVEVAMRKCLDEACGWGSFTVASSVELLGCLVGPGASLAAQWAAPLARLRERVLALAASPLDMTAAIFEYGRRCQPVLAYKAQLWPMPTELIDDERFLLCRLARCSGGLFKKNTFFDWETLGGSRCVPTSDLLAASLMRSALSTLETWRRAAARLSEAPAPAVTLKRAEAAGRELLEKSGLRVKLWTSLLEAIRPDGPVEWLGKEIRLS
ncbi:unnamed protein product [Prorocentrum cordatum]|uniref:Reverse transcriptase domain-containing protein n=1 Tax=Prorocentrum cordatum TaxID=2364126 RepID=A0ABN9XDD3_9DINO|nr:unnamed protein product [Polarella glacialis]